MYSEVICMSFVGDHSALLCWQHRRSHTVFTIEAIEPNCSTQWHGVFRPRCASMNCVHEQALLPQTAFGCTTHPALCFAYLHALLINNFESCWLRTIRAPMKLELGSGSEWVRVKFLPSVVT